MKYRVSAKGLLYKDGKVLFIEYSDSRGIYYALPGGGQDTGEGLKETVEREFKEETDLDVSVSEMLMVREFIIEQPEIKGWEEGIHQIEVIFRCSQLSEEQAVGTGSNPDHGTLGFKWISPADFDNYRIYPTPQIREVLQNKIPTYLFQKDKTT
ncbi:MAG: hydrolase [Bacteroidetes bacterium]|nr:hydrolase [Bacteroidota bacterium]